MYGPASGIQPFSFQAVLTFAHQLRQRDFRGAEVGAEIAVDAVEDPVADQCLVDHTSLDITVQEMG